MFKRIKEWLYYIALDYIEKYNANEESLHHELLDLNKLTYTIGNKAYLFYGLDNEWRKFARYEVIENAIQKLAVYENAE